MKNVSEVMKNTSEVFRKHAPEVLIAPWITEDAIKNSRGEMKNHNKTKVKE